MTPATDRADRPQATKTPTAERLLLVTGTAPGEPGVGGVILKDIIKVTGPDRWHCCWLATRHSPQQPYWDELRTSVLQRRFETGYRPVRGFIGEVISAAALRARRPRMIAAALNGIVDQCRNWKPQKIVAILESPAVIEVVRHLQEVISLPVRSIVWDDVELFCRQACFDRWTCSRIQKEFGEVLRNSDRVSVICENMQSNYLQRYGIKSHIIRHGVARETLSCDVFPEPIKPEIRIGFAGSNTAPDSLKGLVDALDSMGWHIDGRDIVLRLLGARYLLDSRRPQRIEYLGWRSVDEARSHLSECDLLYLPQSFAPENRTFSELSFPTKLSTYLAAQRPILLHAPDYASLSGFWMRHELGPKIHTLDTSQISNCLFGAIRATPKQLDSWGAAVRYVSEHIIGPEQFTTAVVEFLS